MSVSDEEEHILQQVLSLLKDIPQMVLIPEEPEPVISYLGLTILSEQRRVLKRTKRLC